MVSGLLTLLTVAGSLLGPDRPTQRFRIDVETKTVADLTSAGMGSQESTVTASVFVAVTMSDSADGQTAHVVVDSLTIAATGQAAMQISQELADSLRGQFVHAYIKGGRMEGAPTPSVATNPVMLAVVMPVINVLFPGVSSKAMTSQTWSDTARVDNTTEQGTTNSQQIVDWTVVAREGNVVTLTAVSNGTLTAEMSGQQIAGTTVSHISVTTPIGGPATKGTMQATQDMSVLVPSLPDPIPVKVESTHTLSAMP